MDKPSILITTYDLSKNEWIVVVRTMNDDEPASGTLHVHQTKAGAKSGNESDERTPMRSAWSSKDKPEVGTGRLHDDARLKFAVAVQVLDDGTKVRSAPYQVK